MPHMFVIDIASSSANSQSEAITENASKAYEEQASGNQQIPMETVVPAIKGDWGGGVTRRTIAIEAKGQRELKTTTVQRLNWQESTYYNITTFRTLHCFRFESDLVTL